MTTSFWNIPTVQFFLEFLLEESRPCSHLLGIIFYLGRLDVVACAGVPF